ncbi:MAG: DUF2200 domain-containing protein [Acholeplasmataceae bacterium]
MDLERVYHMLFNEVYPLYVKKAERKQRTKQEVDEIILWLTGYKDIETILSLNLNFKDFFQQAPNLNPNREKITGVVCGVRVENIEDFTLRNIRYLDKQIDELAKGKTLDKILRT